MVKEQVVLGGIMGADQVLTVPQLRSAHLKQVLLVQFLALALRPTVPRTMFRFPEAEAVAVAAALPVPAGAEEEFPQGRGLASSRSAAVLEVRQL